MIELLPRPKKLLLQTPETFFDAAKVKACRLGDPSLRLPPEITAFFDAPMLSTPERPFYFGAGEAFFVKSASRTRPSSTNCSKVVRDISSRSMFLSLTH